MSEVRRHCNPPLLSHTHPPQAFIQPVDHLVLAQNCVLHVLIVVPSEDAAVK